jgi:hypothetical protein
MSTSYTSSPLKHFHGVLWDSFSFFLAFSGSKLLSEMFLSVRRLVGLLGQGISP